MIRKLTALLVGGILAAAVYGAAATLNVAGGTGATGQGAVLSCGDVTGSTYLLHGTGISGDGLSLATGTVVTGMPPSDIEHVTRVNIETVADCVNINFFVQLKNQGGGKVDGVGFCEVTPYGGLGYNEASAADNMPGCTVDISPEVNIGDVYFLAVTQT